MSRVLSRLIYRVRALRHGHAGAARAAGVSIGTGCRILSNVATTEPWLVTIGDHVTISSDVRLITHDGSGWLVKDERGRRYRYAPVQIDSWTFIGAGAIILPGVHIGERCVVGAGAIVTRSVPPHTVVAGNPARIVGTYDSFADRAAQWPAQQDMTGSTYRERVDSIAETVFRPPLAP